MTKLMTFLWVSLSVLLCVGDSKAGFESNPYLYFRDPEVALFELNPSGNLFVGHYTSIAITSIRVVDWNTGRSADLFRYVARGRSPIRALEWVGDSTLVISSEDGGDGEIHSVVRVQVDESGVQLESTTINWPGMIVDPLRDEDGHLLLSPFSDSASAYRVSADDLTSPVDGKNPFRNRSRVAKMRRDVARWWCDGNGIPRLAVVDLGYGRMEWWSRDLNTSVWSPVRYRGESEDDWIVPIGVLHDGRIVVISRADTGRLAMYSYEAGFRPTIELILENKTRDLYPASGFSTNGYELRSALYLSKGLPQFQFFDQGMNDSWEEARRAVELPVVVPISESRDSRIRIVWVSSGPDPGRYLLLHDDSIKSELGAVSSRIQPEFPPRTELIEARVPDVGVVEGYLTMPSTDEERPPLVVYPHGGPVGIVDLAFANPEVLYLASRGFAVLQVNFRGSGGLGEGFERAGWREWGRGIEDDIDAVLEQVMASAKIDNHRICIIGASYGGYSALMSVVRHPKRFRCAISTAGATDISLLFSSSDFAESEAGREEFANLVGNPDEDYEEMKAYSPVYRVQEIETPILLIHGEEDRRVDIEHANRLAAMLRLYGKEFRLQIIPGLGHSGWSQATYRTYIDIVADYLDWYLD